MPLERTKDNAAVSNKAMKEDGKRLLSHGKEDRNKVSAAVQKELDAMHARQVKFGEGPDTEIPDGATGEGKKGEAKSGPKKSALKKK